MAQKITEKKVSNDIISLISKKIFFFEDVIQKTILHVQKNKMLDIIGVSEVNNCIHLLFELTKSIKEINIASLEKENTDNAINILQNINNELSSLFKVYGTELFEDLLWICFGNNSINAYATSELEKQKFELLKKYFHPTSYKVVPRKEESKKKDDIDEKTPNLSCFDVASVYKQFHMKVYGIKVYIHSIPLKKSLLIYGIVDDIVIDCFGIDNLNIDILMIDNLIIDSNVID
jgi:hypothetical protein